MSANIDESPLIRMAYATDASAYREVPAGVAYPSSADDITQLLAEARRRETCLIPRSGGTSIAGQVVGSGIVVDVSRRMNKILDIDPQKRTATVQPGVVLDELNLALLEYGLFFSPETSTSSRCTIGGMMGNNSCGSHSLIYGSTRHHVVSAKGVMADGSREVFTTYTVAELEQRFGENFWQQEKPEAPIIERVYAQLINWATDQATCSLIDAHFPDSSLRRRSCGYAIDDVIEPLRCSDKPLKERSVNLCPLLCGSEGTLAFITEITVSLDPQPTGERMALCVHTSTLPDAYRANLICLKHLPDAVELIDGHILDLAAQNGAQAHNRFFVEGNPAGLLIAELSAPDAASLQEKCVALEHELIESGLAYTCTHVAAADIPKVWALRKAGLGLLSGMKGNAKPIGVIEDTAVAPARLPEYIADIDDMLAGLGLSCVFYGHISTGELHLRPIINIKTVEGREQFRKVAEQTAEIVRKHRGSLSGEHGDGRLRGEFIPLMYGNECYALMRKIKQVFDPDGLLNTGKIIDTPPMDTCLRFDADTSYAIEKALGNGNSTYFNWKAAFDECPRPDGMSADALPRTQAEALMCSIEQCNGAGDCRKSTLMGGTLCPAFKSSGEETKTTRARANVLREILTHGTDSQAFADVKAGRSVFEMPELLEVLDSCLACKGCRSECPSNVDMTRLRAEVLQHIYDRRGMPLSVRLISNNAIVERLGAYVRPVYNFMASNPLTSSIIKRSLGFAKQRSIPTLSGISLTSLAKKANSARFQSNGRRVLFYADEFSSHHDPAPARAFILLLCSLGYEVDVPELTESGRAAISKGNLKRARRCAISNVTALVNLVSTDTPLVGVEPSCILSFRDEYPDLVPDTMRSAARNIGRNCLLYDEFLVNEINQGHISAEHFTSPDADIWLHGHCHQKALVGIDKTATALRSLLPGADVHIIPSGCCGMAGSFGYEARHYATSMAVGETVLFPTIRGAQARSKASGRPAIVAAPGTSCRQQIADGVGVTALHPTEILFNSLKKSVNLTIKK